mgnify:CR=1 FL=1
MHKKVYLEQRHDKRAEGTQGGGGGGEAERLSGMGRDASPSFS